MSNRRGWRFALIALLIAAAVARIAACVVWSDDLHRDPDAYAAYASRIVEQGGFVSADGRPSAFRPPLYPLLLAAIRADIATQNIAVLHILLGVATVAVTARMGRRLGLGAWSLLAASFVAFDPLLLRYTPQVMTEVTCTFLAACLLWLAADGRRPFLLGIIFGLAVLARPTFWAFGGLAAAVWIWNKLASCRQSGNREVTRSAGIAAFIAALRPSAIVVAGVAVIVVPWLVRNEMALGKPVLTTTHGGYTLLLANNPIYWNEVVDGPPGATWSGPSLHAWQQSLETAMNAAGIAADDELARDRWAKQQAVSNIVGDPAAFLRGVAYRLLRFWDVAPAATDEASSITLKAVAVYFVVVFGLAIAGGLRWAVSAISTTATTASRDSCEVRTQASWIPALALIGAFVAVHAVYWTDARMRAPIVPAVALFAAYGAGLLACRQKRAKT